MKFVIEEFTETYLERAAELALEAYKEEIVSVPFLPSEDNYINVFSEGIKNILDNGSGIVAIQEGNLIGYLLGYQIDEFFGKCKGIYSPLFGHGAAKNNRKRIYQQLYMTAAENWVKNGYTNHALTIYAHDAENINTWYWLGFGLRCVDAVREVSPINGIPISSPAETNSGLKKDFDLVAKGLQEKEFYIKKAVIDDIPALADIQGIHHLYYRNSPIFMPCEDEDPVKHLEEWMNKKNHHLWMAYNGDKVLGYIRIQKGGGETFVSDHDDIMNITGAYVDERYRKHRIGSSLLAVTQSWLYENGYRLCGVDFESINVYGSNFWNRHFTPYTYSVNRRIDERILDIKSCFSI